MRLGIPRSHRKRPHRELLELAAIHAVDALDRDDRRALERHLSRGCFECEKRLAEVTIAMTELAPATAPLEPTPAARARLLAAATASEPVARHRWPAAGTFWRLATVASLLVATLAVTQVARLESRLRLERELRSGLEGSLASLQAERRELDRRLTSVRGRVDSITSRATRSVTLAGVGAAAGASARAYIDPDGRRVILSVHELPPLPPDRSYQLWLIVGDTPRGAGVFAVDEAGRALHDLDAHSFASGVLRGRLTVAVTIEPAGGRPAPTGPIVLAGT